MQQKLTKYFNKHLVMTFWVKCNPTTGLINISWRWQTFEQL